MENQNEPQNLQYLGLAFTSIENYFQNKVAFSCVAYEQMQKFQIRKKHTEKMEVSNMLKSVTGWEIGVSLIESEPDLVTLSFRTRDFNKYDVSKIAVATGYGGGHPAAAGATLKMPFSEAKKFLLEKIRETYPDLGEP